ncbi:uncharacterized protein RHOBADRAFT_53001 [Rhodotorula graminis WP1]|uniref:GYF domain-containing protein n=1 Tax=Rhodotorula graminis (strain WP1) TaxID=578459 RepID=A0A194S679_RHOGW|nr:uncharacterized protein RHOBADRAFT_53001 [Rhodotorula graminis WP1]KPV76000.1 hypothetical protein RHOBADRAFT_53001 [Rhodotorula graminis WP1]
MAPKRPATTFTQDQPTDRAAAALAGKRVKFAPNNADNVAADPDADDLQLDLDQDGAGPSRKKGKVTTEGYDSDSSADSDGGFGGAGGGRKGRGVGAQAAEPDTHDDDDDDDDMFGGAPEQRDTGLDTKGKKKDNEFLEMGDIEGQEFGKGGDSDDDADDDGALEDEEDYLPEDDEANADEAPRGRRSKKGMGYSLSSFNMKEELSEGRFSADGTYTANNKDPLASHDVWLDGLSKRSIRAAREAKDRLDQRQRDKERDEARSDDQLTQLRDDCMIGLVALVRPGETVARALHRLGTAKKRAEATASAATAGEGKGHKASSSTGGGNDAMDLDDGAPNPSTSTSITSPSTASAPSRYASRINRLTHYASTLLSQHGELEIYDASHEHLVETLKGEGAVRRDWQPPVDPDLAQDELEAGEAAGRERDERERARDERAQAMGRSRVVIARPTAAASSSSAATASNGAAGARGAAGEPLFWYRWKEAPAGQSPDQEYGPYDRKTLATWVAGGFFGDKEDAGRIVLRREGQQGAAGATGAHEWKSWKEVR